MRLVVIAVAMSAIISLLGTPLLINFLRKRNYAQAIKESEPGVPYPEHEAKKGTPSMGGLAIVIAIIIAYFGTHLIAWRTPSLSGLLAVFLMLGLALVGLADDYLKIFKQRSTGLRASTKLIGQAVVALAFAFMAMSFPNEAGLTPASQAISFIRDTPLVLPGALFVIWVWLLITATTNGVNFTDGLDGLAAGALAFTFGAYTAVALFQSSYHCEFNPVSGCYTVRDPLDLAIFAAACFGATFGFLWWNTSPAKIFMGDTGSLALGGAVAALAILSRTELLLVLLGGLFVIIGLSVVLQIGSFRLTGKRIFRMAPLHHHFEMLGWPEVQIVVRFWIIQALFVGAGAAIFYSEWLTVA